MLRARLGVIALTSLYATATLASAVAHGRSPYGFEIPLSGGSGLLVHPQGLGRPRCTPATLTILAVLVVSCVVGLARQAFVRVVFYAALAAWARSSASP